MDDRQSLLRREAEDYLRFLCVERYLERQKTYWKRNYSSVKEYLDSVEENRKRWQEALGWFEPEGNSWCSFWAE